MFHKCSIFANAKTVCAILVKEPDLEQPSFIALLLLLDTSVILKFQVFLLITSILVFLNSLTVSTIILTFFANYHLLQFVGFSQLSTFIIFTIC